MGGLGGAVRRPDRAFMVGGGGRRRSPHGSLCCVLLACLCVSGSSLTHKHTGDRRPATPPPINHVSAGPELGGLTPPLWKEKRFDLFKCFDRPAFMTSACPRSRGSGGREGARFDALMCFWVDSFHFPPANQRAASGKASTDDPFDLCFRLQLV